MPHSAVGTYLGWASRLFSTARLPNGQYTPYAAASVHLWMPKEWGVRPKQHYSAWKRCWASSAGFLNLNGVAAETAGGATPNHGEPYTAWQEFCHARAITDLLVARGIAPVRARSATDLTASIYLHREAVRWGAPFTECDSFRFDNSNTMALVNQPPPPQEDWFDMATEAQLEQVVKRVVDGRLDNIQTWVSYLIHTQGQQRRFFRAPHPDPPHGMALFVIVEHPQPAPPYGVVATYHHIGQPATFLMIGGMPFEINAPTYTVAQRDLMVRGQPWPQVWS